jgi:hypothetical protein
MFDDTESPDPSQWLLDRLSEMDTFQATWLMALAEFDAHGGWATDGALSCVDWLTYRGRMSRSSAYEKQQIARALRARPVLARAYLEGRISYSAVRAMTRMRDPDPEVDEAIIAVGEAGTVADVERLVRTYRRYHDQDLPPSEIMKRRGVEVRDNQDGTHTVSITLTELEAVEVMTAIDAVIHAESAAADAADAPANAGQEAEQSAAADIRTWPNRRADALMDLVRAGLAHQSSESGGGDRYLVHVIRHAGEVALLDGTPLDAATAARLSCDSAAVEVLLGPGWEPVAVGRKTREWTTAQRRAARVRDGGTCRFPGCHRRRADLHHKEHWTNGGPTSLDNGFLLCDRHHTLVHAGFDVGGDPNGELTFYRPDGTPIGTSPTALRKVLSDRSF